MMSAKDFLCQRKYSSLLTTVQPILEWLREFKERPATSWDIDALLLLDNIMVMRLNLALIALKEDRMPMETVLNALDFYARAEIARSPRAQQFKPKSWYFNFLTANFDKFVSCLNLCEEYTPNEIEVGKKVLLYYLSEVVTHFDSRHENDTNDVFSAMFSVNDDLLSFSCLKH